MKTKDKTKESSQHSLCKITRVSLDSRTQYLVQNFPQTCTKVSLFNQLAHEHIYILVVGAMKCRYIFFYAFNYRLDVVYNVFVFKYCTIWLNEKYFSSEMSMDLQKSGIDYKPMECLTFNLVPEAKCWENKPAFLPLLVSLKKKVPNCHTSCFFFNFLFKKKNITDGAGSCFVRIALGVKSQQTAFI